MIQRAKQFDSVFLAMAREASRLSKDPGHKVGAIVVSQDRRSLSMGYNGFPRGVRDTYEGLTVEEKNDLTCHAEANALDNAGFDVTGGTLYTTKPPCMDCAKRIVQRGIRRVVRPPVEQASKWGLTQARATRLFICAGIEQEVYEDE